MQPDFNYDCTSCFVHLCMSKASHFTGKERDLESGLDYFGARYFTSNMGRFLSPDWAAKPEPVPYSKLDNPQSLNLYAYVGNNPLSDVDLDGHGPPAFADGGSLLAPASSQPTANALGQTSTSTQAIASSQANTCTGDECVAQQQNTVSATGQGQNQPSSGGHPIDKDAITNYADQHAEPHSLGKCAAYCRRAFEAGGVDTSGHPIDAKDWGPTLLKNGAAVISPDGYTPQKADVAVFAGSDAHPYGHITIYDGKQWVSDFKQRNMSPYRSGTTPVTIYRFPDN